MLRRFFIVIIFSILLTGLAWWSNHLESVSMNELSFEHEKVVESLDSRTETRRLLIETLDQIVFAERAFQASQGFYTNLLSKLPVALPQSVLENYGIRVEQASGAHLLIHAFSEEKGRIADRISIDQDYELRANFPVPTPRVEYLRMQALNRLGFLRSGKQDVADEGVFRGYFRYLIHDNSANRTAVALGIRPPVSGLQLEIGMDTEIDAGNKEKNDVQVLNHLFQELPFVSLYKTGETLEKTRDLIRKNLKNPQQDRKLSGTETDLEIEPIRLDK